MNEQAVFSRLCDMLQEYRNGRFTAPLVEYTAPGKLRERLQLDRDDSEQNWEAIFTWIEQYLQQGVNTAHPGFVNRMWSTANLPSILAEMVVAVSNTSSCTFESAPVSTLFEKYMTQQLLELVGFTKGEGQMTTGSSNANMIALMCARNLAAKEIRRKGLFGQQEMYVFVNAEAHYSMDRAMNVLGLGSEHLVKIPVNDRGEMRPEKLEEEISRVVQQGGKPICVAATAGTTVRGAYDPLLPILGLREKYNFWLHLDGAWGGAVLVSDTLRSRFLVGIEQVDSFTWDFHKMLGSALMCNILLINNKTHTFGEVLAGGDGSYLFRDTDDNDVQDLGSVSLQCGRRVDSLKWFLDWKFYGKRGFARRVENYLKLCEYAEQRVTECPELEMTSPRNSFNVCFRYIVREEIANEFNQQLRTNLYKRGVALVGIAYIGDILTLRLLVANMATEHGEIDIFFEQLVALGKKMAGRLESA